MKYTGEIFYSGAPLDPKKLKRRINRVSGGGFDVVCLDAKYNQISPPLEAE